MAYEHKLFIMVGRKMTGKSTYLNNLAEKYSEQNPKKKVLIIDVNNSPAYKNHVKLNPENFVKWCQDINFWRYRRIKRFYLSDHDLMFSLISENFKDGLIIFEDCTKYVRANLDLNTLTFITDHRMMRCDLVFTFHSIMRVPKQFWEMATHVIVSKTQDILHEMSNKELMTRIPNGMAVKAAWEDAMKSQDPYVKNTVPTLQ